MFTEENKFQTASNSHQGNFKRVLCVCSAGCLRSPTAADILSQEPYNFNTRSCGLVKDVALVPISEVLLVWAELIVCFDMWMEKEIQELCEDLDIHCPKIIDLDIDDKFDFRDELLIKGIKSQFERLFC